MYPWYQKPESSQVWKLLHQLPDGKNSISALQRPLKEILEGPFFPMIQESWALPSVKDGKLKVCARICGQSFDPFRDQFRA
jgi:hypothetical protein